MYTRYVSFCLSSDPTLTTHSVMEMMKGVSYNDHYGVLSASFNKWSKIKTQYQSDDQRSEALISHTISTHPCLSWNLLASRLQQWGYSEAAAEVTRTYVKGQLTRLHVSRAAELVWLVWPWMDLFC